MREQHVQAGKGSPISPSWSGSHSQVIMLGIGEKLKGFITKGVERASLKKRPQSISSLDRRTMKACIAREKAWIGLKKTDEESEKSEMVKG